MECGVVFYDVSTAGRHHRIKHSGSEKRASCSLCKRHYKNRPTLEQHLRSAHGIYQSNLPKGNKAQPQPQ